MSLIYSADHGPMREIMRMADAVASTQATVLILGETGVGKELLARRIHMVSQRPQMVSVNCGGVPEDIMEAELFGHKRGAFTGAVKDRKGRIEQAHGGTLFLDEVGEMTPRMQTALLRVLDSGIIDVVGGEAPVQTNFRLIAATNMDLEHLSELDGFRSDLFHRLNVYPIHIPPLRERPEDIPLLINHFLPIISAKHHRAQPRIHPDTMNVFLTYSWSGNVRELSNTLERLVIRFHGQEILPEHVPSKMTSTDDDAPRDNDYFVANRLYNDLTRGDLSFWKVVYPVYMRRDLTNAQVRALVLKGLLTCNGNYKQVTTLFNMKPEEYKKFLNFLRKHGLQINFKDIRRLRPVAVA